MTYKMNTVELCLLCGHERGRHDPDNITGNCNAGVGIGFSNNCPCEGFVLGEIKMVRIDEPERDEYGNTEDDFQNCSFPNCGCDGARLCNAPNGPHDGALLLNRERRRI